MHGAGNDFIIVDNRNDDFKDKSSIVISACNRHFGIGADGFMFVEKSNTCDVKMAFYNSDGSEASMCGNGIRCFAKYVYDQGIVNGDAFSVETGDGRKDITMVHCDKKESVISVNMGKWMFSSPTIIKDVSKEQEYICKNIKINDTNFEVSCVHMGVPHCVVFVDAIQEKNTMTYGPLIEKYPLFPQGVNVNFVQVVDESHLNVDTWERGAGKTLACGTGVCSSVIIAHHLNKTGKQVHVSVAGGELKIYILPDETVVMEGKAVTICKGIIEI